MLAVVWSFLTGGFSTVIGGLGKALKWLLANPAVFLALVFCIAFILIVISKDHEISTLQKEIVALDKQHAITVAALTQSQTNVATLSGSLDQQNNSILALHAQGDAASGRFDQIMAVMASSNATTTKKLVALDNAKPGADKCAGAFALVRSNVQ